jgi:hypothetical protein
MGVPGQKSILRRIVLNHGHAMCPFREVICVLAKAYATPSFGPRCRRRRHYGTGLCVTIGSSLQPSHGGSEMLLL